MAFDFKPPPTPAQRWGLAGAMVTVVALAVGGTCALGFGAYVVAIESNPYAGMGAVLLGTCALMALLGGAVLVAIGRRIASEA